jgi:CubicO group peptidase (beta-lactamase class C family)
MIRSLALLFFTALFSSPVLAQLDLSELIKKEQLSGVQLTWYNGRKFTQAQDGEANTDLKSKVNANTIFQAASLSKVVLAYICLELANKKELDLDLPLAQYYTYSRLAGDTLGKKITARMVLHHNSGLPNWTENPLKKTWATSVLQTSFEPGSKWKYSGEGFVFLQLAIQQLLKKDLQQIADSLVFKPLKMKNSSFVWKEIYDDHAAYGHNAKGEQIERTTFFLPNAAFSLTTTTTDYTLFLNALLAKHLKKLIENPISVADLAKPEKAAQAIYWGLGVGLQKNELGTAVWHWGDNGDFKAFFLVYPEKKLSLVCFVNHENGLKLMQPLFNAFFGKASWPVVEWL